MAPSSPTGAAVVEVLKAWLLQWHSPASTAGAENPSCFVGFSGGLDSTVMLHALAQLRDADPRVWSLQALHLDHNLHEQSAHWRAHCQAQCDALGVPLVSESLAEGILNANAPGLEAAARTVRYAFFARHLQAPGSALLLAHHADDQAETLLLRLLQGRGLLPMPRQRALGSAKLWRPLLQLPRAMLAHYAQAQQLRWIEDPSNQNQAMDRNYLRHQLLPLLQARWPTAVTALQRVADHVGQTQSALEQVLAGQLNLPLTWCRGDTGMAVLRAWLAGRGEYAVTDRALAEFGRQLAAPGDRAPELQLGAGKLVRRKNLVCYQSLD